MPFAVRPFADAFRAAENAFGRRHLLHRRRLQGVAPKNQ